MTDTITEAHVVSRDGTRVGFLYRGSGPGLVLIQGAMGTAYNFDELARNLATSFTVYTPDRRGRGISPKTYDRTHTITRDVEDVEAILMETGASRVFGLSSGAMIALEAARTLSQVRQAAVYEPPFYPEGMSHEGVRRLNAEIESGEVAAAMITALLVAETAPAPLRLLPLPVTRLLASVVLYFDDRKTSPYAKLRGMIPGIRYDFNDVAGMDGKMNTLASLRKPVLLISGTKSPVFLQQSCRSLRNVIPGSTHIELEGFDHSGPWNGAGGGDPSIVAAKLRDFFAETTGAT